MKNKWVSWIVCVCSFISLFISMRLFWNMGVFVDEHNLTPATVYGGDFWLYMSWLRMGLLFIVSILSVSYLFRK